MNFRMQIGWTLLGCAIAVFVSWIIGLAASGDTLGFPKIVQPMMLGVSEFLFVAAAFAFFIGVFARVVFRFAWFAGLNASIEGDRWNARMHRLTYLTGPTAFVWRWIMHVDREGKDRDAPN